MKRKNLIHFAHMVDWIELISINVNAQTAGNKNSSVSINTTTNSQSLSSHYQNINYLQPFDTASLAYQMMGLGNFE